MCIKMKKKNDYAERFHILKKGLNETYCETCPFKRQGDVIDLLIELFTASLDEIDKSSQIMEDHIRLFREIEEALFKEKMRGGDEP